MPTANFARIDLDQLYHPFLVACLNVVAACKARGANYVATLGYRSFEQQAKLYFQGRTAPGNIVTHAGPGDSPHNYGLGCDFARIEGGKYLQRADDYKILGEEAERAGLVWGGGFKIILDLDHLEWPGYGTRSELAPLKTVYLSNPDGPLTAVFAFLGKGVA